MQGLKFVAVSALFIWFLYEINHFHRLNQESIQGVYIKLSEEHNVFGRKVNIGWWTRRCSSDAVYKEWIFTSENEALTKYAKEKADKSLKYNNALTENKVDHSLPLRFEDKDVEFPDRIDIYRHTEDGYRTFAFDDENGVPESLIDVDRLEDE